MSSHYYLYCDQTKECIEAVACVGSTSAPRIQPNALGAFLTYHLLVAPGAELRLVQLDSVKKDRNTCSSVQELTDERESLGSFAGYTPPVMVWDAENYHEFMGRKSDLLPMMNKFEQNCCASPD